MTDLESTKLCAEAMGWESRHYPVGSFALIDGAWTRFDPINDDAQAMALVRELKLSVWWREDVRKWECEPEDVEVNGVIRNGFDANIKRAIVDCVAKMRGEMKGGRQLASFVVDAAGAR